MTLQNLYSDLPAFLPEELIENLLVTKNVRIERIVSTGHSSPPERWYEQEETEWVILLQGEAVLDFDDEKQRLLPGDYLLIPAFQKHRVHSTSPTEPTVWLAVFVR